MIAEQITGSGIPAEMMTRCFAAKNALTVPEGIPPFAPDIIPDINPKGYKHIDNNRRPHRKQRHVNKVFADSSAGYSDLFTNIGANPKHLPFNKVFELIHVAKLNKNKENKDSS